MKSARSNFIFMASNSLWFQQLKYTNVKVWGQAAGSNIRALNGECDSIAVPLKPDLCKGVLAHPWNLFQHPRGAAAGFLSGKGLMKRGTLAGITGLWASCLPETTRCILPGQAWNVGDRTHCGCHPGNVGNAGGHPPFFPWEYMDDKAALHPFLLCSSGGLVWIRMPKYLGEKLNAVQNKDFI